VIKLINTLEELYDALDSLFCGISQICQECHEDDCKGYNWLLPREMDRLYENDVEILEINKNIYFIKPRFGKQDEVNIEMIKPECPLRKNKKCTIYSVRPLVCRMYPLNFSTERDTIYLVLHLDCLYSKKKKGDVVFLSQAVELIKDLNPRLLEEIKKIHRDFNSISKFPIGKNKYLRLSAV